MERFKRTRNCLLSLLIMVPTFACLLPKPDPQEYLPTSPLTEGVLKPPDEQEIEEWDVDTISNFCRDLVEQAEQGEHPADYFYKQLLPSFISAYSDLQETEAGNNPVDMDNPSENQDKKRLDSFINLLTLTDAFSQIAGNLEDTQLQQALSQFFFSNLSERLPEYSKLAEEYYPEGINDYLPPQLIPCEGELCFTLEDDSCHQKSETETYYQFESGEGGFWIGSFKDPDCQEPLERFSAITTRMITSEAETAENPLQIAEEAQTMAEAHHNIERLIKAFDFTDSLLNSLYYLDMYNLFQQEEIWGAEYFTFFKGVLRKLTENSQDFENFRAGENCPTIREWTEQQREKWVSNPENGGNPENDYATNLQFAYNNYLLTYGVSEDQLSIEVFEANVLPRLVSHDLIVENGLGKKVLRAIYTAQLTMIFEEYNAVHQDIIEDPRVEAEIERLYNERFKDVESAPPLQTVMNTARQIFSPDGRRAEIDEIARDLAEETFWIGEVEAVNLREPFTGNNITQGRDGTATLNLTLKKDGSRIPAVPSASLIPEGDKMSVTAHGRIFRADNGKTPVSLTSPVVPKWVFKGETEDGEEIMCGEFPVFNVKVTTSSPEGENTPNSDSIRFLPGGERFYRGTRVYSENGHPILKIVLGDEDGGLFVKGGGAEEPLEEYEGDQCHLLPGYYPSLVTDNPMAPFLYAIEGPAVRTGDGQYLQVGSSDILEAFYRTLGEPNPRRVISYATPRASPYNLDGSRLETEGLPVSVLVNPVEGQNVWTTIFSYGTKGQIVQVEGDTAVPLLTGVYGNRPQIIEAGGEKYYAVAFGSYPRGPDDYLKFNNNPLIEMLERKTTDGLFEREGNYVLAVPVDGVQTSSLYPLPKVLWRSQALRDMARLSFYLSSLSLSGNIPLSESAEFMAFLLRGAFIKSGYLRTVAFLSFQKLGYSAERPRSAEY